MSSYSGDTDCPNCGEMAEYYEQNRPFNMVAITCLECGFYTETDVKQMDLDELNEMRSDRDLEKLKELPDWVF